MHQVGPADEGEQLRDLEQFTRWAMLSAAREVIPGHRTASCSRFVVAPVITGIDGVQVLHRSAEGGQRASARYGNLTRCANVWACPVCSPRIAQQRAEDLRALLLRHAAEGGRLLFVTLTHRHTAGDDLANQITLQGEALTHMQRQRSWRDLCRRAGVVGVVRALEFTHGQHGWHPHFHLLVLVAGRKASAKRHAQVMTALDDQRRSDPANRKPRPSVQVPRVRDLPGLAGQMVAAWMVSAGICGLEAVPEAQRAEVAPSDLATLERLADYLSGPGGASDAGAFGGDEHTLAAARIAVENAGQSRAGDVAGAAYELAGAALKLARSEDGATPFELLRKYTVGWRRCPEVQRAGALFAQYVEATKGRRALSYSNGLRALYALAAEMPDEAAAGEQARPEERELLQIDLDDWRVLLRGNRGNRGRLLEVARLGDATAVHDLVRTMVGAVQRGETRTAPPPPPPPSPVPPSFVPEAVEPMPVLLGADGSLAAGLVFPSSGREGARAAFGRGPRTWAAPPSGSLEEPLGRGIGGVREGPSG